MPFVAVALYEVTRYSRNEHTLEKMDARRFHVTIQLQIIILELTITSVIICQRKEHRWLIEKAFWSFSQSDKMKIDDCKLYVLFEISVIIQFGLFYIWIRFSLWHSWEKRNVVNCSLTSRSLVIFRNKAMKWYKVKPVAFFCEMWNDFSFDRCKVNIRNVKLSWYFRCMRPVLIYPSCLSITELMNTVNHDIKY